MTGMGMMRSSLGGVRGISMLPRQALLRLPTTNTIAKVSGRDSAKFLNGLITLKMIPGVDKKNMTSITEQDLEESELVKTLQLSEEQLETTNWGLIDEDEYADEAHRIGIRRDGRYGMALNSKGRVLSDLFIYPTPFFLGEVKGGEFVEDSADSADSAGAADAADSEDSQKPSYLLEFNCAEDKFKRIFQQMHMHKLNSQVDLAVPTGLQPWLFYSQDNVFKDYLFALKQRYFNNKESKSPEAALQMASQMILDNVLFKSSSYKLLKTYLKGLAIDDREPDFGLRMIFDGNQRQPLHSVFSHEFLGALDDHRMVAFEEDSPVYDQLRTVEGIIEQRDYAAGARETLPFENNLDYMNGVNYNKGCYVGQELTIRTHIRDSVRKRVMPVQFYLKETPEEVDRVPSLQPLSKVCEVLAGVTDLELKAFAKEEAPAEAPPAEAPAATPATDGASNPFGVSAASRTASSKVGSVIRRVDNLGFASVDQSQVDRKSYNEPETNLFAVVSKSHPEITNIAAKVYVPEWWPEDDDELNDLME